METSTKCVWTREEVSKLPASSFLYAYATDEKKPGGAAGLFPYQDADSNFSFENFMQSLASLGLTALKEDEKKATIRKAHRVALNNKVELQEQFLDALGFVGPLSEDWAFHTMQEFNRGAFVGKYSAEELDLYGRKLASVLTKTTSRGTSKREYDEDGNLINSGYSDKGTTETEYVYQDGLVVRVKNVSKYSSNTDREYGTTSNSDGETPAETDMVEQEAMGELDLEIIEVVEEVLEVVDPALTESKAQDNVIFMAERFVERATEKGKKLQMQTALDGRILAESIKSKNGGMVVFDVPLFVLDEMTANNNRYTAKCAENLLKDMANILKGQGSQNYDRRSDISIMLEANFDGIAADMRVSHDSRFGAGNEILEIAGQIVGGYIAEIESKKTFVIKGETVPTSAGKDVAALLGRRPPLLRGVSLFGLPTDYEENKDGGHDVNRMHLLGADFTNNGANLKQFSKSTSADFFNVSAA